MRHPNKRGNDILFTQQGHVDRFDHYCGPLGGDIRQSIQGREVENRDDPGGDAVQRKAQHRSGKKY